LNAIFLANYVDDCLSCAFAIEVGVEQSVAFPFFDNLTLLLTLLLFPSLSIIQGGMDMEAMMKSMGGAGGKKKEKTVF